jgi:hypothetical protein
VRQPLAAPAQRARAAVPLGDEVAVDGASKIDALEAHAEEDICRRSALALTTCSLAEFAAAARRAVAATGHDAHQRYGVRKVFLAAVHATLGGEGAIQLEAFKRRMVRAHRAGLLVLARADLVAAMPPAAVAGSEVSEGGAEFHFVLDDAARDPWADDAASPEPSQGGW